MQPKTCLTPFSEHFRSGPELLQEMIEQRIKQVQVHEEDIQELSVESNEPMQSAAADAKKHRKDAMYAFEKRFQQVRPDIIKASKGKCMRCGMPYSSLHVHHLVHRSKGGTNSKYNLIALCPWCHIHYHSHEPIGNFMKKKYGSKPNK